jgi:hypothetical protein
MVMKFRFLTAIALAILLNVAAFGQNCKLKTDKVDEFTGEVLKETKDVSLLSGTLGFGLGLEVKAVNKNGLKYLDIHLSDKQRLAVDKGAAFYFKTTSGEIIELSFYEFAVSKSRNYADSQAREDLYNFLILDDQSLQKLKASDIEKIRFVGVDGYIEKEVSRKNRGDLKAILACI